MKPRAQEAACVPYRSIALSSTQNKPAQNFLNRAVGNWGTVLGNQVVATAILDRLLHNSHVLTIRGDSYRLREKPRSGLIKATPAPASAGASQ